MVKATLVDKFTSWSCFLFGSVRVQWDVHMQVWSLMSWLRCTFLDRQLIDHQIFLGEQVPTFWGNRFICAGEIEGRDTGLVVWGLIFRSIKDHKYYYLYIYVYRWKPQGHLQRFFYIYLCHLCKYSMYRIILLLHTYNVRPLKLIHTVVWQLSKLGFMGKTSTAGQHTCFYI